MATKIPNGRMIGHKDIKYTNIFHWNNLQNLPKLPWRPGLVVSSLPATEETRAMGREIESRQGIGW
jgi:hypothetical protein